MKLLLTLLLMTLTLIFSGCGSPSSSTPPPEAPILISIEIAPEATILDVGNTQYFEATGLYTDGSTKNITDEAQWILKQESDIIVSVNSTLSYAKAVKVGQDKIVATLGTIKSSADVEVVETQLVSLTISPKQADLLIGTRMKFDVEGLYSDDHTEDLFDEVTWTPSDTSIIKMDYANWVESVSLGDAVIMVTLGDINDSADVHVYKTAEIDYIKITPEYVTLTLGEQQRYTATAYLDNGDNTDVTKDTEFSPKSDEDALIIQVGDTSNNSRLTAIGLGTATVVGYHIPSELYAEATVEVTE